jgi:hypothetical protein
MIKKLTIVLGMMMMVTGSLFAASVNLINSGGIVRFNPSITTTNATTLKWRVTFNAAVSNVTNNTGAFSVGVSGGSATYTISSVTSVSGNIYEVTVSSVSVSTSSAVLTLSLVAGGNGITKTSNGDTPNAFTGVGYSVDQTSPSAPTLTEPNSTNAYNNVVKVIATLPESPKSGSVNLKFTNNSTSLVSTFVLNSSTNYNFTFNINVITNAAISSGPSSLSTGTYTVTLTFQDAAGNSSPTVTQNNVLLNNAPTLPGITAISVCDNSSNNDITSNLIGRDLDNGQTLTWTELTSPVNGTLSGFPFSTTSSGGNVAITGVTYTPDALFIGTDSFTIEINDGVGGNNSQTFYVTVNETKAYYRDVDNDGYGDINDRQWICTGTPTGYVLDSTDCDDNAVTMHAKYPFYQDNDHDGYGINTIDSVCAVDASTPPSNSYSLDNTDCNDAVDSVWQTGTLYIDVDHDGYDNGTASVCYGTRALLGYALSSLDSDCDDADNTMHATFPFYVDTDGDGTGAGTWQAVCSSSGTAIPTGYSLDSTDCDNGNSAIINPIRYFVDNDADGYGTNIGTGSIVYFCQTTAPTGYSSDSTDCDDASNSKHALFSTFYADADNDTYGDMNGSIINNVCAVDAVTAPAGYSVNNTDCDDTNNTMNAYFAFFSDNDGDTYGAGALNLNVCAVDGLTPPSLDYVLNNSDCNDADSLKHAEFPFYTDADGDTYGSSISTNQCAVNSTTPPSLTYVTNANDCNDADSTKHDNFTFYVDADNDTYGSVTTSVLCAVDINTPPTTGYSTNNTDCNDNEALLHTPIRYYLDADNDTYGTIDISKDTCSLTAPLGYVSNSGDCDDNNPAVHSNSLPVTVSISVYPSTIIYTSHVATFTAAFSNQGTAPSFQWFKNGIPVATSSAITYSYVPTNGDVIKCVLTSNLKCTLSPTDTSNSITILVTNPPSVLNDYPCGAVSASTNSGSISGLPTVRSAYDNGGSAYGGLDNRDVASNPPSGPSLIYYNVNCTAAGNVGDPSSTCSSVSSNSVWYKFRAPTFEAGVTIRSQLSYGQAFIPTLTAYVLSSGTACNSGVFTELQCSSTGTLALSSSLLNTYLGQTIYLMVQNPTTEQQCSYVVSIQGVVADISLSNQTTTTMDVAFPTFSLTAPTKITLYWQRVGSNGASYINLPGSTSTYTIGGLLSGNGYRVWAKFSTTGAGSQIYCTAKILGTITGCGGNLPAPSISANGIHCASVYANFTNPPASVPNNLQSPPSSFPYRLIWFKGGRGQIQALSSVPSGGYLITNLTMGATYHVYYSYKCIGGAVMTSSTTQHTACVGIPRTDNKNHEYIVNGVHYVNVDIEEVIYAATSTMEINDENIHNFEIEEVITTDDNNNDANEITTQSNFELVPNPAAQNVTINYNLSASETSTLKYQLMDIQGKLVFETIVQNPTNAGSIQVDLSNLNEGIYLVNLQSNGFNSTKKLMITK